MSARINLRTGKIIGAEKGSFAWWHEKGHLEYDNSELGIINGVRQNMALYSALISIVCGYLFGIFKLFATISVIYLIGLVVYEELWCNAYARDKLIMKGGRNKYGTKYRTDRRISRIKK